MMPLVRSELAGLHAYSVPNPPGIRAKLDANESPYPLAPEIAAELGARLAEVALHRYPDGTATELRRLLAMEAGCQLAELTIGNGSDELILLLIATFAHPRPGATVARIAYPVPSFVVYRIATLANGAVPVEIPLDARFELDCAATHAAIDAHRPNLIFLALPNNPTGTLWPRTAVVELAERHPDTIVVADEAYVEYSGVSFIDLLARFPNVVVLRTLSKIGLAALRIGYLVGRAELVHELEKIRPPYNLGALNQAAALHLLGHHRAALSAHIPETVRERDRLAIALARRSDLEVFPSQANFILVRAGAGRATELWHQLIERGVLVRNFDRPGPLAGCLRITIGTAAENDLLLSALLV